MFMWLGFVKIIVMTSTSIVGAGGDENTDYSGQFIALLNARMSEYAGFSYDNDQPGFQLRRRAGEHVRDVMGAKDNKWVPDQVMDIEIPDAMKVINRVLRSLV